MTRADRREIDPLAFDVVECRGVGPKTSELLRRVGIATIGDLLHYFPRRHLDRRSLTPIASVRSSHPAVVQGEITRIRCLRPSRRLHITECMLSDDTGSLKAVWFNQPYLMKTFSKGTCVVLSGKVSDRRGLQMENPDIEFQSAEGKELLHTMGLIPEYPLTEGLSQKRVRTLIRAAHENFLDKVPENLPEALRSRLKLLPRRAALRAMHFPSSLREAGQARERMVFEEFLALQLSIQASMANASEMGFPMNGPRSLTSRLDECIPFSLTVSQKNAIGEIFQRMEYPSPMNVLLQGDVGSGKTIVAVYAMLRAVESGKQAVLMVPTELLAEQHLTCVRELVRDVSTKTALLSGNQPQGDREYALNLMREGKPCIIVGTHALIEPKVHIASPGLVVIDEQHRFGVNQRAALRQKGICPDLIIMTATPIPRTLALALYGNFQTICIKEFPPGRHPVETRIVRESDRHALWEIIRMQVLQGHQIFVVCAEIGDLDGRDEREVSTVMQTYARYREVFPDMSIDALHGRMSAEQRDATMRRFRENNTEILIATTIVEVGVDVPNATAVVVENADRFGLAQLHQLRGRVGRSRHKSYCFLTLQSATTNGIMRLEALASTNDGFEIAERDLTLRGPGEFLGTAQSGVARLRVGHLVHDAPVLERARKIAAWILAADPHLQSPENTLLQKLLTSSQKHRATP